MKHYLCNFACHKDKDGKTLSLITGLFTVKDESKTPVSDITKEIADTYGIDASKIVIQLLTPLSEEDHAQLTYMYSQQKISDLIPRLDNLHNHLADFVKKHQGEKGFIKTTDQHNDTINVIFYDGGQDCATERRMLAIRWNEDCSDLEILTDFWNLDVDPQTDNSDKVNKSHFWHSLKSSDIIYYIPTIYSIAESIEQYV